MEEEKRANNDGDLLPLVSTCFCSSGVNPHDEACVPGSQNVALPGVRVEGRGCLCCGAGSTEGRACVFVGKTKDTTAGMNEDEKPSKGEGICSTFAVERGTIQKR